MTPTPDPAPADLLDALNAGTTINFDDLDYDSMQYVVKALAGDNVSWHQVDPAPTARRPTPVVHAGYTRVRSPAERAHFLEGVRVEREGTTAERHKYFGTPGVLFQSEAWARPEPEGETFDGQAVPMPPAIFVPLSVTGQLPATGPCHAPRRSFLNTYCQLDAHGPDVLHVCPGVRPWDDTQCEPARTLIPA